MSILLIDDLRDFRQESVIYDVARTSDQAIHLLSRNTYDEVFWDHDLGGDDTTMKVVAWLLEESLHNRKRHIGTCYIHTSNPVGAVNLKNAFESRYLRYRNVRVNASDIFIVN